MRYYENTSTCYQQSFSWVLECTSATNSEQLVYDQCQCFEKHCVTCEATRDIPCFLGVLDCEKFKHKYRGHQV